MEEISELLWKNDADIELIRKSAIQLKYLATILVDRGLCFGEIALPLVGCGRGGLDKRDVLPILHHYLDDRFVLLGAT